MESERRRDSRWKAHDYRHKIREWHDGSSRSEAIVVDVSKHGIGLRADRRCYNAGMQVWLEIPLSDESIRIPGVVRFVDPFFPRVGLQMDASELMEKVVEHARSRGFLMLEVKEDTLLVHGHLTLTAAKEFAVAGKYRKLDLSRVGKASVAGAGIIFNTARSGARIDRCSGAIAPLFDSLGICSGKVCVAQEPCDLPKRIALTKAPVS